MNKKQPLQVKLGTSNYGFYHLDVQRDYTLIQKDKMAHNVLKILTEDNMRILMGTLLHTLNMELLDMQPELKTDKDGYSVTLPSLLKDLRAAKLIQENYDYRSSKVQITDLGRQFLARNVITEETLEASACNNKVPSGRRAQA